MTTKEKAELLDDYSRWEGTELGEYWGYLVSLYLYSKDYMTDAFWLQIGVEIEIQYQIALDMIEDGDIILTDE